MQLPRFSISLRQRLVFIVLLSVIPALALLLLTAADERRMAAGELEKSAFRLANFVAREERQLLYATQHMLEPLGQYLRHHDSLPEDCDALFARILERQDRYINLGVANASGAVVCSAIPDRKSIQYGAASWYKDALHEQEFSMGRYDVENSTFEQVVYFGLPVRVGPNERRMVVFASMSLTWLNKFEFDVGRHLPPGAQLLKLDRSGQVLASYPQENAVLGQRAPDWLMQATFGERERGMGSYSDGDGNLWRLAFMPIDADAEGDAKLILQLPRNGLYASSNAILSRNLLVLGAVSVLTVLAAWSMVDLFLMRKLNTLYAAAKQMAGGDFSYRIGNTHAHRRLDDLAQAFDDLAAALQKREGERDSARRALEHANIRLRKLAAYVDNQAEIKRKELARDIHDQLGQSLTALNLDLAWLKKHIDADDTLLLEKVNAMTQFLNGVSKEVHRIAAELRPHVLDDLGLADALLWLAEQVRSRSSMEVKTFIDCDTYVPDDESSLAIFRVMQEALTNVLKHSGADAVTMHLLCSGDGVEGFVLDNGCGLRPDALDSFDHLGILGMRERIERVGGEFSLNNVEPQGVRVAFIAPYGK